VDRATTVPPSARAPVTPGPHAPRPPSRPGWSIPGLRRRLTRLVGLPTGCRAWGARRDRPELLTPRCRL